MDMKTWWDGASKEVREQLAKQCGTTPEYLSHIAHGHRNASVPLAKTIERQTGGLVTRQELRPDIYDLDEQSVA